MLSAYGSAIFLEAPVEDVRNFVGCYLRCFHEEAAVNIFDIQYVPDLRIEALRRAM